MTDDSWYVALLGLAESFRQANNINECVRCLKTVFSFSPPPLIVARTHLQLGQLLATKTTNEEQAQDHLRKALEQANQHVKIPGMEELKLESASLLAKAQDKAGNQSDSKQTLCQAIEECQANEYWHCRLTFQLASVYASTSDYTSAHTTLQTGVDYAFLHQAHYTRTLFLLSKTLLFLCERKFEDANPLLQQVSPDIEGWVANYNHLGQGVASQQKEYLQMFYLVLQVCYYLMVGQVKSVKAVLKQLQQSIQTITAPDWPSDSELAKGREVDRFLWMSREQLCVLVYLVTVMHSMQAGFMEKAERYTDKAIVQIGKLKAREDSALLSSFQVMLMEHMIQCRLVMGNKSKAVTELGSLTRLLSGSSNLLTTHKSQLHTLLGLYAMSMNCMTEAETQFNAALRTSKERELWTFTNLNLAIVYLRQRRDQEFLALIDRINPEQLPSSSHAMKAAAYYIHGLQAFFSSQYGESKRYLRETLKMANAEDLNRLTSCSLVLLGHIFLSLGNAKESMNMVTPAMQLASKIPDVHVQLWASSILKDLYQLQGDKAKQQEGQTMHNNYNQTLLKDHFQASQQQEHNLINWTDGDFPKFSEN